MDDDKPPVLREVHIQLDMSAPARRLSQTPESYFPDICRIIPGARFSEMNPSFPFRSEGSRSPVGPSRPDRATHRGRKEDLLSIMNADGCPITGPTAVLLFPAGREKEDCILIDNFY